MPRYILTEHEESQVYLTEFELSAFTLGICIVVFYSLVSYCLK